MTTVTASEPLAKANTTAVAHARRTSVLIDAESYYAALRDSLIKAEKQIVIVAWEFHSETELIKEEADDGYPRKIGALINTLLDEREELEVYLLAWDHSFIYFAEREWELTSEWHRDPHSRLHCVADTTAPTGASHHQKIVAIDNRIAFCGGIDVSISRWDTSEHETHDERRTNPDGKSYPPFHDIQLLIDGEACTAVTDLVADRWCKATGERLPECGKTERDPWPKGVDPDFENIDLGITQILASSTKEKDSKMERLHLDLIKIAEKFIFIENQYLSSHRIAEQLAERLKEESGPEVCVIMPRETSGWLVESTVALMRDRLIERLQEADIHDRFVALSPLAVNQGSNSEHIYVHAKLMIIDDRILKVGSANLNNRSMSVDSELDLTICFEEKNASIKRIRQDLLAQHQSRKTEDIDKREEENRSILPDFHSNDATSARRLIEIPGGCPNELLGQLADSAILDPATPIDPEFHLRNELHREERRVLGKRIFGFAASITLAGSLGFGIYQLWNDYLPQEQAYSLAEKIAQSPFTPALIFLVFVLGGTLGIPLNFMLITTAIVIGTQYALLYGVSGAMVSSALGFGIGHVAGKPLLAKLDSKTIESINDKIKQRSFRSVAVLRLLPIAPFFLINLVAGTSRLDFRSYAVGTLLGMAPGMCMVVLLANRMEAFARGPNLVTTTTLGLTVILLVSGILYLRKALLAK